MGVTRLMFVYKMKGYMHTIYYRYECMHFITDLYILRNLVHNLLCNVCCES